MNRMSSRKIWKNLLQVKRRFQAVFSPGKSPEYLFLTEICNLDCFCRPEKARNLKETIDQRKKYNKNTVNQTTLNQKSIS